MTTLSGCYGRFIRAILPLLGNITSLDVGRQGVAIFGRCNSARVSELLTSDIWRTRMTLFVSSVVVADCSLHLVNTSELKLAMVVHRVDFRSRELGA